MMIQIKRSRKHFLATNPNPNPRIWPHYSFCRTHGDSIIIIQSYPYGNNYAHLISHMFKILGLLRTLRNITTVSPKCTYIKNTSLKLNSAFIDCSISWLLVWMRIVELHIRMGRQTVAQDMENCTGFRKIRNNVHVCKPTELFAISF